MFEVFFKGERALEFATKIRDILHTKTQGQQ